MATDREPEARSGNESETSKPRGSRRERKRLGRGLEDVSHLFLSESVEEPEAAPEEPGRDEEPEGGPTREGSNGVVVLKPVGAVARDELATALKTQTEVVESGLRVIDENVPGDECGIIDLLAVDSAGQLCIIDVGTATDEALLLRAMSHFDWAVRNMLHLGRLYRAHGVNFALHPRLVLISPDFSTAVRRAARHFNGGHIDLLRYHAFALPDATGVHFEAATVRRDV